MSDERVRSMVFVYGMPQAMLCTLPYEEVKQLLADTDADGCVEFPALSAAVGSESGTPLADSQPVLFTVLRSCVLTVGDVWAP